MDMKQGRMIDGTLTAASSSTENGKKWRDAEMHHTKKENQYSIGIKVHIDAPCDTG